MRLNSVFIPFVIFGFTVEVDETDEEVEEENFSLGSFGFVVVVVEKGTTFSSKEILIEVDVIIIGSAFAKILFSLESTVSS